MNPYNVTTCHNYINHYLENLVARKNVALIKVAANDPLRKKVAKNGLLMILLKPPERPSS